MVVIGVEVFSPAVEDVRHPGNDGNERFAGCGMNAAGQHLGRLFRRRRHCLIQVRKGGCELFGVGRQRLTELVVVPHPEIERVVESSDHGPIFCVTRPVSNRPRLIHDDLECSERERRRICVLVVGRDSNGEVFMWSDEQVGPGFCLGAAVTDHEAAIRGVGSPPETIPDVTSVGRRLRRPHPAPCVVIEQLSFPEALGNASISGTVERVPPPAKRLLISTYSER